MRGKTIEIYLHEGNPRGIKECSIKGQNAIAYLIPRSKLNDSGKLDKINQVGIYFLIGKDDDDIQTDIYIGEAETLYDRLKQHNQKKDFWQIVICFVSGRNDLNKAHIKFLENHAYSNVSYTGKYNILNGNTPTQSNLTPSDKDFALDFFDQIKILISTLGYPIFDKIKKETNNILYCIGKGAKAEGEFTEDGLVVFAGSSASDEESKGFNGQKLKQRLINEGIIQKVDKYYIFQKDYTFSSPSAASDIILGNSTSGWLKWKNKEGKTLDELYRQN